MISVRLDENGEFVVRWPRVPVEILRLGRAYVAREQSLPVEERLCAPPLALIEEVLAAAQAEHASARHSEAARAVAAEHLRQTLNQARRQLNVALLQLKAKHVGNLALLEAWGVDTVAVNGRVVVRKPRNDLQWMKFLAAYVRQEQSLEPAQQLSLPPLAEMAALHEALDAAAHARTRGRSQRKAAVETRNAAANHLLDLLQAAAVVLVMTRGNGAVTNELEQWGFLVVAR